MKRYWTVLLFVGILLLTGCRKDAEELPPPPPAPETGQQQIVTEQPPAENTEESESTEIDETVYHFGTLEIAIPKEYDAQMIVETELEPISEHWQPLISLTERASAEAYEKDESAGEEWGMGWLCSISRLDRIGFEAWASGDDTGTSIFARDEQNNYYLITRPTDVRFYREGGAAPSAADMGAWQALNDWAHTLPATIIEQNDLTAYDARELLDADYTYPGAHKDLGYRLPGEMMDLIVFSLSQPATQGEGGVWCVERVHYVYSDYGEETHLVFPASMGIDMTAADYYERLQAECDVGEHENLLTPEGAALDYAKRITWLVGEDVSASDFEVIITLG